MNEILTIPAGVIQPKPLLMWLRGRRDLAREMGDEFDAQDGPDDYEAVRWYGRAEAFGEVMQHIQFGGAS